MRHVTSPGILGRAFRQHISCPASSREERDVPEHSVEHTRQQNENNQKLKFNKNLTKLHNPYRDPVRWMSARVHSSAKRFTHFDQPKQLFRMRSTRTPLERTWNAITNERPTPNRTPPQFECAHSLFKVRHFRCDRAAFTELNHTIRFDCTSSSSSVACRRKAIKEDDRSLRQRGERIRFMCSCPCALSERTRRCRSCHHVVLANAVFCWKISVSLLIIAGRSVIVLRVAKTLLSVQMYKQNGKLR